MSGSEHVLDRVKLHRRSPVTLAIPISHEIQMMFDERDKRKSCIGLVTSAVLASFFVIDFYCSSESM